MLAPGEDKPASGLPHYALKSEDERPLGYVDSTFVRCFVEMGPVDFNPRYKYQSDKVNGAGGSHRLYGFSIPLVGDLNGDGKPEIVALSYSSAGVNGYANGLFIFNGQTGKEIARYPLPVEIYPVISGYHGSIFFWIYGTRIPAKRFPFGRVGLEYKYVVTSVLTELYLFKLSRQFLKLKS